MSRLSLNYQQSHDIDWFAHVGDVFIHAMSFGGKLPEEVNDWRLLCEMIVKAYHLETIINEGKNLNYNDQYIDSRLMMQFDNDKPNETERREIRSRYLRHFEEMAIKGFYSFDRDLNDENLYHLIVKPSCSLQEWKDIKMPQKEYVQLIRNNADEIIGLRIIQNSNGETIIG
jgi:hypothetical protein